MLKDIGSRIDGYKVYAMLLSGGGAYWVARKKNLSKYQMIMAVLMFSSLGMLLPDIIDGVRNQNKPRLRELTGEEGADLVKFGKDAWIPLIIVGALVYFMLKKEDLSKKQLLFLLFFVFVFVFMFNQAVSFRKKDDSAFTESDFGSVPLGETLLDAELLLLGLLAGVWIANMKSDPKLKHYALYGLLGAGSGYAISNIIRGNLNLDTIKGTFGKERQLREKRLHSRMLLLTIGKSIVSKDKEGNLGTQLDTFVDGLNEKELIVMDRIYEMEKDRIERGEKVDYSKIADSLRNKNFDQKDTDTFLQITNSYVKFLTGQFIPLDTFGADKEFQVNNTIHEFELDKDGYLKKTGRKFRSGENLRGKERWVWVNSKIDGMVIRKQIRMVQLDGNRYILYVGVEQK
jgi:hypothetical protein